MSYSYQTAKSSRKAVKFSNVHVYTAVFGYTNLSNLVGKVSNLVEENFVS